MWNPNNTDTLKSKKEKLEIELCTNIYKHFIFKRPQCTQHNN